MYVRVRPPLLSFSRVFALLRCHSHNPVLSVLAYDVASITELTDCQEGGEGKGRREQLVFIIPSPFWRRRTAIGVHYHMCAVTADDEEREGEGEQTREDGDARIPLLAPIVLSLSLWHERAD